MNLIQPIINHAKIRPDALALVDGDREIRFDELADLTLRTASHLAALGVVPGDRVGLCLRDSWEHVVAFLAAARMGAVAVPLYWRATPAEIAQLSTVLSVKVAFVEAASAPALDCAVVPADAEWQRSIGRRGPLTDLTDDWNAAFVISATSGSTGAPKFAIATHLQFYCGLSGFIELVAPSGHHRYLSTLPLYFAAGRLGLLAHLIRGDTVLLHGGLLSGQDYVDAANAQRATIGFVMPSLLRDLLTIAGEEPVLPGMVRLISGGAPLFAEEKRASLRKISRNSCEMYGTAETNAVCLLRSEDIATHGSSIGQPHSLIEVQVVDDADRPLSSGQTGRLRLRGPTLASPLTVPGAPPHSGFRAGWYYPGEIASLDDRGYIFLAGRASEVIIRRGAKIYPTDVEAALQQHPDVLECAVIGRLGADNEEEVIAFVVGHRPLDLAAMVAHCRTHLTPEKRPQHYRFVEALPRNPSGKIDKPALAKLSAEGR